MDNRSSSFSCCHLRAEPSIPQRVVVLGSGGFIGARLVQELLKRNIPTRPVSSKEVDLTHLSSVGVLKALLQPGDAVVFASAITPDKGKDTAAFMKNLKMGEHVAAALDSILLSHLLYISSDAVFPEDIPPIDEFTMPAPNTLYGLMHVSREKMLAAVLDQRKVPWLILRPCAVYGSGDTHNGYGPNRFVKSARDEQKIKLFGQGEERRPHLHIDDCVSFIINSLVYQNSGLLHTIPARSLSFAEVAEVVTQYSPSPVSLEYLFRSGSPTHKHFIDSNLRRTFPNVRLRSFSDAIKEMLRSA